MEEQSNYVTEQEVEDAMEMLGKGYDHPSIEIESPREVVERRNGKLVETERPAFVKIYTNFKSEMKDLDEIALKVWLYVALSVNRCTDEAHPGLRTIADETGFAVNTVRAAIERLETKYNLLEVERGKKKYNRYFPLDYVSAKRSETVSLDDTDSETVSTRAEAVSADDTTVSSKMILNQRNQRIKPDKRGDILDGILDFHLYPKSIKDAIRDNFKLTPNWDTKFNAQFMQWAVQEHITPEQIKAAAQLWGKDKRFNWSVPTLKGIQEHWLELTETSPDSTPAPVQETPEQLEARRAEARRMFGVTA
jgi:DNA-binding transcriptional regulator YhcF (GntR family)